MGEITDTRSTVMLYLFKQHVFCITGFFTENLRFLCFDFHCELIIHCNWFFVQMLNSALMMRPTQPK